MPAQAPGETPTRESTHICQAIMEYSATECYKLVEAVGKKGLERKTNS